MIEVAAAALGAEGLLEDDLDVADVVAVPQRGEKTVGEAHDDQVLGEFFAEVVVDAVQLRLREELRDAAGELLAGAKVSTEGFLHDNSRPAADAHAPLLDVRAHRRVHRGRERR